MDHPQLVLTVPGTCFFNN